MRNLKTKQRLTILFSLYFFLFLIVLAALFIASFRYMYRYQTRKDLVHEFGEIVNDHIRIDNKGVTFKKDKNGDTLRTHLFNDGISAQFIASNGAIIRSYGAFEFQNIKRKDALNLRSIQEKALLKKQVFEVDFDLNEVSYAGLVSPLIYNDKTIGIMVISKSLEGLTILTGSTLLILASLGGLGLLGSFFLGYVFIQNALQPLYRIIWAIEGTNLNRLKKKVFISGHPDDEFVLLGKTFNTMLERLNEMSQRQKEFIANASHELKTPLTRAISSIDVLMLKKEIPTDSLREVKENIFEINELIDTLLVLGKMHEGEFPKGKSDLKEVIADIIKQHEKHIQEKSIHITVRIHQSFTLPIPPEYAKVIFTNLISNAIKFSSHNAPIEVIGDSKNESVSVIDHGIGFSTEEKEKIFDRFYRSKAVRSTTKGYGLGLSLVKVICREYGIKIAVESVKGNGTTMTLTF